MISAIVCAVHKQWTGTVHQWLTFSCENNFQKYFEMGPVGYSGFFENNLVPESLSCVPN